MSSITQEQVLQMDLKSIGKAMNDPAVVADKASLRLLAVRASELMAEAQSREAEVDAQLNRVVPPSTEALAAEAEAMAAAPVVPAEVPPVPAVVVNPHEAEDAELKKVGVTVTRDANGKATRYSQIYQVADEDGTTIGRPTNLSAATLPELMAKQREVHTQATRAFHRLKRQKLTQKAEKTILTPEQISEAAKVAVEEKDPAKAADVIKATIESAYQTREQELRKKELREEGRAISNHFMRQHLHDYNPCEANKKAMAEYFVEHNLEFTLDNLEIAFQDLKEQGDQLVPVASSTSITTPVSETANPVLSTASTTPAAPAIPVAESSAVVPASAAPAQPAAPSQPAVEATVTSSAAAPNVQPAARRPGVNGSLPPGSLSAQRPGTPDPVLARKEFMQNLNKMSAEEIRRKKNNDPQFVKQLASYGIKIQ